MKNIISLAFYFLFVAFIPNFINAQGFQKIYRSDFSNIHYNTIRSIQTSDNGYLLVGEKVLKTDQSGQVQWGRTFPGIFKDVAEIAGGNYIATGSYNGMAYIVSLDSNGNMTWSKTYPGTSSGSSIEVTSGGLIVAGHSRDFSNQPLFMKINNSGDVIWQLSFSENQRGSALEGLTELSDGSFMAVGYTTAIGNSNLIDAYVIRVDQNGNKLWDKEFQYTSASRLYSIVQGPGSSVLIAGVNNFNTGGPNEQGVLVSLDLSGNMIYSRTFNDGSGNQLWDVEFNPSSNRIYAVGESNHSSSDGRQAILHILDNAGGLISSTEYGMLRDEVGYNVMVDNNELVITGNSFIQSSNADIEYKIIKTDITGQSQSCDDLEEAVSFNTNSVVPIGTTLSATSINGPLQATPNADPGVPATFIAIDRLLPIQVTTTQPDCNFSGEGIIEITSSQPNAFFYTVIIDGGPQRTGSFPMTIEDVSGGSRMIEVTSVQGCFSGSITVDNNPPDFTLSFSDITESCPGQSTGSVRVTASGTGSYSYQWSNGRFGSQLNNVPSGTYEVYVRDFLSNCRDTASVVIPEAPSISIDSQSSIDATSCVSNDGSISFSASGDPSDTFLYSVNGGTATNSTGIFTGLNPGEYTLTVISSLTQCEFHGDTLTIAGGLDPAPAFEVSSDSVCRNEIGVVYRVGNITGVTYSWNAPSGSSIASGNGTSEIMLDFNGFFTGTLKVSYQYPSGCGSDTLLLDIVGSEQNYAMTDIEVACEQDTFGVPLEGTPGFTDVLGLDFCMEYDENVITPTGSATIGDVVTGGTPGYADYYLNISTPGIIYGVIYYTSQAPFPTFFSGTGLIIDIDYTLNPGVPSGTSTDIRLCGVTEGSLAAGNVDNCSGLTSTLSIFSDPEFNSIVEYWDRASKPLIYDMDQPTSYLRTEIMGTDGSCNPTGYTVLTDTLGEFSFNSDSASHIAITRDIPGEFGSMVDCTNMMELINGADQNRALKVATNDASFIPTAYQILAADVNLDGSVSSLDVTLMSARSVMSICGFPNNGSQSSIDWLFVPKSSVDTLDAFQLSTSYPLDDGIGYSKNKIPSIPNCIEIPKTTGPLCIEVGMDQYAAILLGDVSGNWKSEEGNTARVAFEEELIIDFSTSSTAGGQVVVPITYAFSEVVNALDFYIEAEEMVAIESLQANQSEAYSDLQMNWNLFGNTHLLLSSFSQTELPQQGIAFYMTMDKIPSGKEIVKWNQLSKAFVNGKEVGVRMVPGDEVTGISEGLESFYIYPNPSSKFIHIDSQKLQEPLIRLLSLNGQTVRDFGTQVGEVKLDIRGIRSGIYILQLIDKREKYQQTIVIK